MPSSLVFSVRLRLAPSWRREGCTECLAAYLYSFAYSLMFHFYFNLSIPVPYVCYIYIYRCFPLHLLVIFVTGPSLHCLEGNSLECSIRLLSAFHHALFFDLHPSMPDGVHGPLLLLFFLKSELIKSPDNWNWVASYQRGFQQPALYVYEMVYIIGASSLRNTIQGLPYQQKSHYSEASIILVV